LALESEDLAWEQRGERERGEGLDVQSKPLVEIGASLRAASSGVPCGTLRGMAHCKSIGLDVRRTSLLLGALEEVYLQHTLASATYDLAALQ
jgi:hypothetical protein